MIKNIANTLLPSSTFQNLYMSTNKLKSPKCLGQDDDMFEFSQLVTSPPPLHVPALLFRPPDPPPRTTVSALYAQPTVPLCVCVVLFTIAIYVVHL